MTIVLFVVLGGLAGWLAARLIRGEGLGLWGNIGVGVVGAFLGGTVLAHLGVRLLGPLGQFITAALGAILLLVIARLFDRSR